MNRSAASQALVERLRGASPALRRELLTDLIAAEIRTELKLTEADVLRVDRGFFDLGMDSLMMVTLKERLELLFGTSLPATVTLEYSSVTTLAGYFETLLGPAPTARPLLLAPSAVPAPPVRGVAADVESLSDDEVGAALSAELAALDLGALSLADLGAGAARE